MYTHRYHDDGFGKEYVMSSSRLRAFGSLLLLAMMSVMAVGGAAGQEAGMSVTVKLEEYKDSGFTGTAVLTETTNGGTHVSMELSGAELAGNHPTHIHTGTCDNFDPNPLYPLDTVNLSPVNDMGVSETDVNDVKLSDLYDGEYVILVHKSPQELTNYLVCGEIGGGTVGTAAPAKPGSGTGAHDMPATGVGSSFRDGTSGPVFAMLFAALAVHSVIAAFAIRRSER
jgi:hypothetical protein